MKEIDVTWFCIAIAFFAIGIVSNRIYLVLGCSFLVLAFISKEEE
ncbi:hypothetical protein [Enterococcus pallens]|uniref:Uncharacterized protein n=1 Tax=Enterococcus pallens ATCC BAA-351 TaxID=1158607 RepID=R2QFB1_9ENTE|nr:hypothetical protein [Enterococcus pallens]EOH93908.1 hypothetical protein UAU_02604 [Enterococcus pallens ATCC BAA-351]EOU24748.1 hypothetical protein I588_00735 [Enterococcus pallens ATCC BAA-351]OJG77649.1 hypothetical protein RV10_GL002325 [Enterococcus pallens]